MKRRVRKSRKSRKQQKMREVIILKPRQPGLSTMATMNFMWDRVDEKLFKKYADIAKKDEKNVK